MGTNFVQVRACVESARDLAAKSGLKLVEVLSTARNEIFAENVRDGKVMIGSNEAGGSVTFALPAGHAPLELLALLQEALDYCAGFPDPNNPPKTVRRIKRLRVSFLKARV